MLDPKKVLAGLSARQIVGLARSRVCTRHPYFSDLLWALRLVETKGHGTMSVDDGLRLFYDPDLVKQWGVEGTPTVLFHEVQHVRRQHSRRGEVASRSSLRGEYARKSNAMRKKYGMSDWHNALNYAFDLEINDEVTRAGWEWPSGMLPLLVSTFNLPSGKTGEFYLRELLSRVEEDGSDDQQGQHQKGGSGSPQGGESKEEEGGDGSSCSQGDGDEAEGGGEGEGEGRVDEASQPQGGNGDGGRGEGDASPNETRSSGDAKQGSDSDASNGSGAGRAGGSSGNGGDAAHVGRGHCGGCAGHAMSNEMANDPSLPDKATSDEVEGKLVRVADAVRKWASGGGRGAAPGSALMEWAEGMFAAPKLNPMTLLQKEVRSAIAGQRGRVAKKWTAPNRRRGVLARNGWGDEAPLMPVLRGPRPRVVLVLDRSGSMGWGEGSRAARATSEAMGFVTAARGDTYGIAVDSVVQKAVPVRSVDELMKLNAGGGGTDMRVGLRAAADPKLKADVIVLLTDGETPWLAANEMPNAPIVTVVINDDDREFRSLPPHFKARAVFISTREEEE